MKFKATIEANPSKDAFGVTVSKGKQLFFPTRQALNEWFSEQKRASPEAAIKAFSIVELELDMTGVA